MKNKIFKLLSVVLALAMVFVTCICAVNAEEAAQDVVVDGVLYPAMASGTVNGAPNTIDTCVATHERRLYTVTTFRPTQVLDITVGEGCRAFVQFFKADGTYNAGSGWIVGPVTKDINTCGGYVANGYFKVTFDSTNEKDTPAADALSFTVNPNYVEPEDEPDTPVVPDEITVPEAAVVPELTQGTIDANQSGKIFETSTNRLYIKELQPVADYESVTVASDYKMWFQFYNANGDWIGSGGSWKTGTVALSASNMTPGAVYFRTTFGRNDNADITPDTVPNGALYLTKAAEKPDEPDTPVQTEDIIENGVVRPLMGAGTVNGAPYTIDTCVGYHAIRLYTVNTYSPEDIESITVAEGCRAFVQCFNADGSYNSGNGWLAAGTYTIDTMKPFTEGATQFKITFDSADGTTTPPADGLTMVIKEKVPEDVIEGDVLYPAMIVGSCNGVALDASNLINTEQVNRLATLNVYQVADIESITIVEGCRGFVQFFNEDGSYNGGNGWLAAGTYKIATMAPATKGATQFKVTLSNTVGGNDVEKAPADGLTFKLAPEEAPHEHLFENYTYNEDATCTANGTATGKCECGEEDIIEAADTKLDHFYNTEYDIDCNTCGEVREAPEKAENSEVKDGLLYIDGQTSIRGMFKVGEDYYFADWGGVIKTGKIYVKSSYCDLPAGKEYTFGEDGKLLDGIVDGVLYIDGITASKGIYEIDGDYYFADWGGVIKTDGKYYTGYIYAEGLTAGEYAFGADGKMLDGIVEKDGAQYIYVKGVTVAPGEYEVDGVLYKATWGGLVVAE